MKKAAEKHCAAHVRRPARRHISLTCYKTGDEGTAESPSTLSQPLSYRASSSRGRRLITEDTGVILLNNRLAHPGTSPASNSSDRTILETTWLRRDSTALDSIAPISTSNVGVLSRRGNISEASFQQRVSSNHVSHTTSSRNRADRVVKVDIGKAISQMLPWAVLATAASALVHPPSFSW